MPYGRSNPSVMVAIGSRVELKTTTRSLLVSATYMLPDELSTAIPYGRSNPWVMSPMWFRSGPNTATRLLPQLATYMLPEKLSTVTSDGDTTESVMVPAGAPGRIEHLDPVVQRVGHVQVPQVVDLYPVRVVKGVGKVVDAVPGGV